MRVAVDAALASPKNGGVGNYTMRIIDGLSARSDLEIVALVPDFAADDIQLREDGNRLRVEVIASEVPAGEDFYRRRVLWEQHVLPHTLDRYDPDVFLGPVFMAPSKWPGPKVITVHDLAFERSASYNTPASTAYYTSWARQCAENARAILTVSNSTRADVADIWGISANVYTTHLAPCVDPPSGDAAESARRVAGFFGLAGPFALFLGDRFPRKNVRRLIRAAAREDAIGPEFPVALALRPSAELELLIQEEGATGRVRVIGRCPPALLPDLYRTAAFLVYPSLFEGFGLPPLEAMACGTPVAATNASAVPEVLKDHAVYFDPADVKSIAGALGRLCRDQKLRDNLAERGIIHASGFTWEKTCDQTARVLLRTALEQ